MFVQSATAGLFPTIVDDQVRSFVSVEQSPSCFQIGSIQGRGLSLSHIFGHENILRSIYAIAVEYQRIGWAHITDEEVRVIVVDVALQRGRFQ